MATDVYITFKSHSNCPRIETKFRYQHEFELFTPIGALQFVAIDTLRLPPGTGSGNQFLITILDRYSQFTGAVPTTRITPPQACNFFSKHWVISYGIHDTILSDNG